jgi:hypothetical protein
MVAAASVILREDYPGDRRLVGYVVPKGSTRDLEAGIVRFLAAELPAYMVPSYLVVLESFPLAPSGKVDRSALPPPGPVRGSDEHPYRAPQTPAESTLCAIWQEVLHRERVGVDDDVFALGGESLTIFQIATRAAKAGISITPRLVFQKRTIARLLEGVAGREGAAAADSGIVPLARVARTSRRGAQRTEDHR